MSEEFRECSDIIKNVQKDLINVLPQTRQEFDDESIDELAQSISQCGLINSLNVVQYSPKEAVRYLDLVNEIWNPDPAVQLNQLTSLSDESYLILLAGERRLRSLDKLGKEWIKATIMPGLDPQKAILLQLNENIHKPPEPESEAHTLRYLYEILLRLGLVENKSQFIKRTGRAPQTVRNALAFADLPSEIRNLVYEGLLRYGHGVALTRLNKAGMKPDVLKDYALMAISHNMTVADFRKAVKSRLNELEQDQMDAFEGVSTNGHGRRRARVVAEEMINAITSYHGYVDRVIYLKERGLVSTDPESPFSERSPARQANRMLEKIAKILSRLGTRELSAEDLKKALKRADAWQFALTDAKNGQQ